LPPPPPGARTRRGSAWKGWPAGAWGGRRYARRAQALRAVRVYRRGGL
jgi:hypothetical protein